MHKFLFANNDEKLLEAINYFKSINKDWFKIGVDTETTGLDPFSDNILLLQLFDEQKFAAVIDVRRVSFKLLEDLVGFLFSSRKKLIMHNAKFDLSFLIKKFNLSIELDLVKIHDTMITEQIINNGLLSNIPSLADLVSKYFSVKLDKSARDLFINYSDDVFSDEMLEYSMLDTFYLVDLSDLQLHFLKELDLIPTYELESKLVVPITYTELYGVLLDTNKWLNNYHFNVSMQEQLLSEIVSMTRGIKAEFFNEKANKTTYYDFDVDTFNPRSWQQTVALFNSLGYNIQSSDSSILAKLDSDIARKIITYREWGKLVSAYGLNIIEMINPHTGRLHTKFNQMGASSGRFSSSNPNLQNIPRDEKYRQCFIAPEGRRLITADYSQIELRIAGDISKDPVFIDAYRTGKDLHAITASILFNTPVENITKEQRSKGKTFNFSVLYGASEYKVSSTFGIPVEEAKILIANWRSGFPELSNWISKVSKFIEQNGYSRTVLGRKRFFNMPDKNDKAYFAKLSSIIREGVNMPIQGTSADMIKFGICSLFEELRKYDTHLVLTVHDEVVFECPNECAEEVKLIVERELINAGEMFVKHIPIEVDCKIGDFWGH